MKANEIIVTTRGATTDRWHIGTIYGTRTVRTPYAVAIETAGIDGSGNLCVTVWTNQQRTTGYHIRQNVHTDKRTLQRMQRTTLSRTTAGKQLTTETLPITPWTR